MESKKLDEKALEKPELVDSVQAKLDALDVTPEDIKAAESAEPDEKPEDSTPKNQPVKKAEAKAEPEGEPTDSTPKEKEGVEGDSGEKTLPDEFRRAAVHQGWKPEDIDEFFGANPDAATRTFENIYNSTNTLSRRFAEIGRAQRQLETAKMEPPKAEIKKVDVARLKEEYDLDPATIAVLEEQNRQLETFAAVTRADSQRAAASMQQQAARSKVATDAVVEQQITNFFETEQLKPYRKFYGELDLGMSWQDLSAGQKENRLKVLEQADLMVAGAALQGRQIKVDEALELAHLLVTEPVRERVIRNQIKDQATKRTKTLKPSGRKIESNVSGKSTDGKPQTREEIIERAGQRLAKIFG